jgi:hypothetical protein
VALATALFFPWLTLAAPTFTDANWISMGTLPGTDGSVYAAGVDGSGNLYIGGDFSVVGEVVANQIAKWNGSNWSALGSGMDGIVWALAVSGSDLYAGGWFRVAGGVAANHIAKWNGTNWTAVGSGVDDAVFALTASGTDLYVGGWLTRATNTGGTTIKVNHVAKWNGSTWSALGLGLNGTVEALAFVETNLYVGGQFATATNTGGATVTVNLIAKWNGSTWSALSSGLSHTTSPWNSEVNTLAVLGGNLYVGGYFNASGGNTLAYIAKWNGSNWSGLSSGMDSVVQGLSVSGSNLYAGGSFRTAGGVSANGVAKWDGNSWSPLGSGVGGMYSSVYTVAATASDLFAGGPFTRAGGNAANYIAKWNGSDWSSLALELGVNGSVRALTVSGKDLYLGGEFTTASGVPANYIAKWNGIGWWPLGSGITAPANYAYSGGGVSALAIMGSDVCAGGYFTTAGSNAANSIAKWNGNSWSELGGGVDRAVNALAVSGSDLYVGGEFTIATNTGGASVTVNRTARWNGSGWSALGFGLDNTVRAMALSGADLYVGGNCRLATNSDSTTVSVNGIAKWNGSYWSAMGMGLGEGPYPSVYALAISGSNVYAGGFFRTAGGIAATNIARWDGNAWSALGSGLIDPANAAESGVLALVCVGSDLYAGGSFTSAGGTVVKYIAKWNGTNWTALGSGLNGYSYALGLAGSDLYVAGYFTIAGAKVSAYLARAIVNPPVLSIEGDRSGGYFIRFSGVPGSSYRLQRAPGVGGPWAISAPQTAPASASLEFWDLFPPAGQAFYRSLGP